MSLHCAVKEIPAKAFRLVAAMLLNWHLFNRDISDRDISNRAISNWAIKTTLARYPSHNSCTIGNCPMTDCNVHELSTFENLCH